MPHVGSGSQLAFVAVAALARLARVLRTAAQAFSIISLSRWGMSTLTSARPSRGGETCETTKWPVTFIETL